MKLVLSLALVLLAACAAPTPHDYAAERPVFDFKTYFNGKVDGWGMRPRTFHSIPSSSM